MNIKDFFNEKPLVVNSILLKTLHKLAINLNEFLFLLYFFNDDEKTFDVEKISNKLSLCENEVLSSFNSLIKKKLILVESKKNSNGKISEYINLDYLYNELEANINNSKKEEMKENIYTIFEKEFARPISSIEYEIIRAWLEKDFSEELILGALKEAVYNGVTNLRYIDKILYEWQKKGFKTIKDVDDHITKRTKDKSEKKDLFDYNWLDEENNE